MTGPSVSSSVAPSVYALVRSYGGLTARSSAIWPRSTQDALPGVPGFVDSSFSPLVAEVAERCLRAEYGEPPAEAGRGARTAIVVMSPLGDVVSARRVARTVASGGRVGPLMFFQSVPNAVAGHVAARWGLAGPVVCVSSTSAGVDVAALLMADGDADEALVVLVEQARTGGDRDRAEAVLIGRSPEGPPPEDRTPEGPPPEGSTA